MRMWALMLVGVAAFAQPRFEVVSVKPADPGARGSSLGPTPGGGFSTRNAPLVQIVRFAYDLQDFQLSGPGWIETERYDVVATAQGGDIDVVRQRVRAMLADRFRLKVHTAPKEQTVYALRVAKGGSKLKVAAAADEKRGMYSDRGSTQGSAATTAMLSGILSRAVGRAVLDKTGLTDRYDFVLRWAPDEADTNGPTIFTAIQEQLGLRLDSEKGEVETIVIDRVERGSEN